MSVPFHERISCTIPEASEASGLGRSKIYELMAEGRIETTSVGRRRLILVPSLFRLVRPQELALTTAQITEAPAAPMRGPNTKVKARARRTSRAA